MKLGIRKMDLFVQCSSKQQSELSSLIGRELKFLRVRVNGKAKESQQ